MQLDQAGPKAGCLLPRVAGVVTPGGLLTLRSSTSRCGDDTIVTLGDMDGGAGMRTVGEDQPCVWLTQDKPQPLGGSTPPPNPFRALGAS